MAVEVLAEEQVISMTARSADRLLGAGDGDAALLYLHLLRRGGRLEGEAARRELGWPAERLERACRTLGGLELVRREAGLSPAPTAPSVPPEPQGPPEYTSADIARELEGPGAFPHLVRELERRLGKVLSPADLKTLYTIYDYLALPAEVILLLATWCIEETERKYGPGRKPRLAQLRKEAFVWRRLGVDTPEAADAHVAALSALRERERALLPRLGIAGRAPVEGERKYIAAWSEMGFDDDAIALAYERTVLKKGALNWAYMNSILRSWHQKGLHTVGAVEAGDSAYRRGPGGSGAPGSGGGSPSPGAAARLREDMDWMDRFLEETGAGAGGKE